MDRQFLAHHIDVFLEHEPLFADATPGYRAMTVHNLVEHLAGNWETIVKGQEQLAAHKAAREKQDAPMEFVITERHMPPVKMTPKEYQNHMREYYGEAEYQNHMREYYGEAEYQRIMREYYGETIIEETSFKAIIGSWLSKLGIKR